MVSRIEFDIESSSEIFKYSAHEDNTFRSLRWNDYTIVSLVYLFPLRLTLQAQMHTTATKATYNDILQIQLQQLQNPSDRHLAQATSLPTSAYETPVAASQQQKATHRMTRSQLFPPPPIDKGHIRERLAARKSPELVYSAGHGAQRAGGGAARGTMGPRISKFSAVTRGRRRGWCRVVVVALSLGYWKHAVCWSSSSRGDNAAAGFRLMEVAAAAEESLRGMCFEGLVMGRWFFGEYRWSEKLVFRHWEGWHWLENVFERIRAFDYFLRLMCTWGMSHLWKFWSHESRLHLVWRKKDSHGS